jgi:hypothetical protein
VLLRAGEVVGTVPYLEKWHDDRVITVCI